MRRRVSDAVWRGVARALRPWSSERLLHLVELVLATVAARRRRPARWELGRAFTAFLRLVGEPDDAVLTLHRRPLAASGVGTRGDAGASTADVGVVLQGPVGDAAFLGDTLRIYRRHFADATLVVSTWEGEEAAVAAGCRDVGAVVVTSAPPANAGVMNVNRQIVSTRAGIAACRIRGCRTILKSRTDQRCYAPHMLQFLQGLLRRFPPAPPARQRARIIVKSIGTYRFSLYGLTDMFLFGDAEDLHDFWSIPFQAPLDDDAFNGKLDDLALVRFLPEVYLTTGFLARVGHEPRWTLEDSWRVIRDRFLVVDDTALDLVWTKYPTWREASAMRYEDTLQPTTPLTFADWIVLQDLGQGWSVTDAHERAAVLQRQVDADTVRRRGRP
jgi:hypothetical protein